MLMSLSPLIRRPLAAAVLCAASLCAPSQSLAQDQAKPAAEAKQPATHTAKKSDFKIEVSLAGVFESQKMTPVSLSVEAWKSLTVLDAVEHGARVKAGDSLVKLDLEGIDETIAELENDQKVGELSLELAKAELKSLEAMAPIDLAAAERAKQVAEEDFKRFLERQRPLSEKSARFSLKSSEHNLEYQEEELKQLEKMYKADDLTEDTEEIILKRARNDVDQAKFGLELAQSRSRETLETSLPRQETALKEAARRESAAFDKAKIALPLAPTKARLNLEKLELAHRLGAVKLTKLKADRERMLVKAPVAGIVYYGHCEHGKWTTGNLNTSEGKLTHGASLYPNVAFMTIVEARPIFVRASAAEKDLQHLREGLPGKAASVAYPDVSLPAKVFALAAVPAADGKFDVKISVETGEAAKALMPGMTCNVTLVAFNKADAIVVPASAVFADEAQPGQHYVYRVGADGSHQKAEVVVGQHNDKQMEIAQGLLEGDKILLEKP
jgi:multidrug efflux pump subunit AcrA (membrane-fusion protein)